MPFDVEGARKAGYTDAEIADHLGQQSRFDTAGARKSGYSDTEIITHLRPAASTFNQPATDSQKLLASPPMRLAKGLKDPVDGAAQMVMEGINKAVEFVSPVAKFQAQQGGRRATDYIDQAMDKIGGPDTFLGDVLGIRSANVSPKELAANNAEYEAARTATAPIDPQTGKRDPGFDAMRLAGNVLSPVNAGINKVLPGPRVAETMGQIARRGAVAGAAGAAAQPVMGDNFAAEKAGQVALGAGGGAVLGPILAKVGDSAGRLVQRWRNSSGAVNVTPERLQQLLRQQLEADGIDLTTIPDHVFQGLSDDVRAALARGRQLDPTAALRQRDFDALNLPSLQGQITRNPAQWQREFNLAGVEGVGEPLQAVQAAQSQGIANRFQAGARGAQDRFAAGQMLGDQLRAANETAENNVRTAYQAFRQSTGRDLEVPLQGLAQDYATTLRDYGEAIPGAVRRQFEELGLLSGKQMRGMSIEDAERLTKVINKHYGSPDRAVRGSLDELRRAVQRSIVDAADTSATGAGAEAASLASDARALAAGRFQTIEQTPALRSAIQGAEPDDFVRKFIVGGKVNEIERMQSLLGADGREQVRAQTVAYLQNKAFGANAAGDGKAAQATFNQELLRIGRPKLEALLGKDGADEMYRIGRVLAYIKQTPEGATPNTSGTGQMLTSMLGRTKGLKGLPYVNDWMVAPLGKYADRRAVSQALSGPPTQPTQLDPETVKALATLFAPVPIAGGGALGYSVR